MYIYVPDEVGIRRPADEIRSFQVTCLLHACARRADSLTTSDVCFCSVFSVRWLRPVLIQYMPSLMRLHHAAACDAHISPYQSVRYDRHFTESVTEHDMWQRLACRCCGRRIVNIITDMYTCTPRQIILLISITECNAVLKWIPCTIKRCYKWSNFARMHGCFEMSGVRWWFLSHAREQY